jgi:regulatory protein
VGELEQLSVAVGDSWTAALAERAASLMAAAKARKAALAILARRAVATEALRDQLARKGHAPSIAADVVRQLVHDGWIDDRVLAEAVAESTLRRAPAARTLIVQKLRARNVPENIAQETSDRVTRDQNPLIAALGIARQRIAKAARVDRTVALRRAASALARRGFDDDLIAEVMERLAGEAEHGQPPA